MTFFKNNFANMLTLGNLMSGSIGVIHLITGNYKITALCIIISLVLDFFDGLVARALKANSPLGVQLDSLADMVSFGVLPGVVMYKALEPFGNQFLGFDLPFNIQYIGLFITLFSCLRLAIFNLDEEQTYYFKGLNTPSNTVLIFGLYYAFMENGAFSIYFENTLLLIMITLISSLILVSPVKMIAMKFKSMQLKDNYPKIALLAGGILILLLLKIPGIPVVVLYYILISVAFQRQLK
ncbi:CDP-alcohol phosphatidyltransferase [Kaistella daneshvariae]|uniref:CDP-alcohol phosphatidyltransferase n=1 Tax=Kaistella daneshvariae TaxID=2487074 RepID=A0ABN5SZK4_9FLAO|nr:CDP-alcohol phosphatidyltransferase family protein [Kaistella daneshvariae]AZI67643.1 CDP-alcohol phosphatidyltransferase [Kaistella daneshvariae]